MLVITLVDRVKRYFNCTFAQLYEFTAIGQIVPTWNGFFDYENKWMKELPAGQDPGVFRKH